MGERDLPCAASGGWSKVGSFSEKSIEFQAVRNGLEFGACPRPISQGKGWGVGRMGAWWDP